MSKGSLLENLISHLGLSDQTTSIRAPWAQNKTTIAELCQTMLLSDGEYSSLVIAEQIITAYEALSQEEKIAFFTELNEQYDLDTELLQHALRDYETDANAHNFQALSRALNSDRREILTRLNLAPGGTATLVKMRGDLLRLRSTHPELMKLDVDFQHLFSSWFNRGFLILRSIDWTTPAHILEKIIAYEAVHEIPSWKELRKRLAPKDRLCFAFFHPMMPDEPLVFVQVALTEEVPDKIIDILDDDELIEPKKARCAVFYSISNCHLGLTGVSFGNFLIKQVAIELKQRFPNLKASVTLSPLPKFRDWLEQQREDDPTVTEKVNEIDTALSEQKQHAHTDWLQQQAANYLVRGKNKHALPFDPVARFHLRNGANLERINPFADLSEKGQQQSLGVMVNYKYDLSKVESNHELYMLKQKVIHSSQVKKLLP